MQKPSSCWKGSTDHWWCDFQVRLFLNPPEEEPPPEPQAVLGPGMQAKRKFTFVHRIWPIYISNYLKHHQTSIRSISDRLPEPKIDLWRYSEYGESIGETIRRWTIFPLIFDQRISDDFVGFRYFQIMLSSLMFSYVFIWSTVQLGRLALLGVPIVLSGVVRAKGPVLPPCCDVLWCVVMWESQGYKPTIYWGWYILY